MAVLGEALGAYERDPVNANDRPESWGKLARLLDAVRDVLRWDVVAATLRADEEATMKEEGWGVVEFPLSGWWVIKARQGRGFTRVAGPFLTRTEARKDADARV